MLLKLLYLAREALRTVTRFPFRSGLIFFSAMSGVAGVIISVDFASSGRQEALRQIKSMGVNVLAVRPQQDRNVGGRTRTGTIVQTLLPADYVGIRRDVPSIVRSSALFIEALRLKSGDLSTVIPVVGCEPEYFVIKNWNLAQGQFFADADERRAARVAVLGATVARDIFGQQSPIGLQLSVNRTPFEVIGVLTERGQGLDVAAEDDQIYVPLRTAMHRLGNVDYLSGLILEIANPQEMDSAADSISNILRQRHRRVANLPDDFTVQNQKSLVDTQLASSARLQFYVRWIALSGLAVSCLGILAVCWIAVKGRSTEIGTRRALGANAFDIFSQILLEAMLLSCGGCAAGLALGWGGSRWLAQRSQLPFVVDWPNIWLTLAIALAMNLAFALLPAARAAAVSPIRALKYE